jgi:hypothetical protein
MSNFSGPIKALDDTCIETFGTAAIYAPRSGDPYEITLIDSGVPELEENKTRRNFFVRTEEFEADPVRGDVIEIDSVRYTIHEIDPDAEGGWTLAGQRI